MAGHLRELRPGVWQVMYDIAPNPVTGRRRQRSKVVHGSEVDAGRVLDQLLEDVDRARDDRAIIRFHDLRHTWATLTLEAGVPAYVVADPLGHSSIVVTMGTHTQVPDGLDRNAAELVARRLGLQR